jgi:SHS2 domain-containing protein
MGLRLGVNHLRDQGRFTIELVAKETLEEALSFQDSGANEVFVDLLKFDDAPNMWREEPYDVLATLLFHNIHEEHSLGRAMENVLTAVLNKGMAMGRAQAIERLKQVVDPLTETS